MSFFLGKDVATILGYSNTKEALKRHVSEENKMIRFMQVNCRGRETRPQQNDNRGRETRPQENDNRGKYYTIINEPGFYELVFGSKLEFAKKFHQWVFNTVLPSIRKLMVILKCLITQITKCLKLKMKWTFTLKLLN